MTTALARRSNTPGRHVYDVIVVGGQLPGAVAAALLARRGLQTLHVAHDGLAAPYAHKDYVFPHLAMVLPGAKAVPLLDEVGAELGLTPSLQRLLRPTGLQLLKPGNWYELKVDAKERAAELKRALRTGADAFELDLGRAASAAGPSDAFLAGKPDLVPEGFFARWRFKRALKRVAGLDQPCPLPKDSPLWPLLPWVAPVEDAATWTQARTFGQLLAGVCVAPGGREALTTLFVDRARELGADVVDDVVEQVVFDGSAAGGVRLARGETVYRAPLLVAATDLDVLQKLVPEGRGGAAKVVPRATKALFTLNVVVPERALPRGLGELALLDFDGGPLLLQVTNTRGPAIDSETTDLRTLTVSCVAPVAVRAGHQAAVKAFIETVWARLAQVLPFTRPHVKCESTPWLDAGACVDRGVEPWPLFERTPGSWLDVTGVPTSAPWKRLLLANRQVVPGLGLEGELFAAVRAVDRVERTLKKNDPLKKRTA